MAAAAGHDRVFLEFMRPMTTDAFAMPVLKERGARYEGLGLGVAAGASAERFAGRCVLVLMTSGAGLKRCLAARGVRGLDILVTVRAGRRNRLRVLVRTMTARAALRAVSGDGGSDALLDGVAAFTVSGRIRLEAALELGDAAVVVSAARRGILRVRLRREGDFVAPRIGEHPVVATTFCGENVAARAVGFAAVAEALFCGRGRMRQFRLLLVAHRAATRRDFAHRSARHVVTVGTSHLGFGDVHAVAAHGARGEPGALDVQALPARAVSRVPAAAARKNDRDHQRQQ